MVVLGLALCACSATSTTSSSVPTTARSTKSSSSTATKIRPAPTTTTSTPEFSFDDSVPPPKLVNTGTNYVAILKSLEAYGNWTAAHRPDPSLPKGFVSGGTDLMNGYTKLLTMLHNKSQRFVERIGAPDEFTITSQTADAFSATVTQRITLHRVVNTAGKVVEQARFTGDTIYHTLVVRMSGRWYLAANDVTQAPKQLA